MKISHRPAPNSGFTLIELLVVISIIALLAGIALPAYTTVKIKAEQTKALTSAKQVALLLKIYAGDNNGSYPNYKLLNLKPSVAAGVVTDSNAAFAQLFPDYTSDERIFFVANSAFTPTPPDNQIDNPQTDANVQTLATGENHWAYVTGLSDTSNSLFPLIADGFATSADHKYAKDRSAQGGVWEGKRAIVIRTDGSGAVEKVAGSSLTVNERPGGGDLFAPDIATNWLGAANTVVNPR